MSTETANKNASPDNSPTRPHRHSLQHKRLEVPPSNFRHTQSHRFDSEGRKKTKKAVFLTPMQATITEAGSETETDDKTNETQKPEKKPDNFSVENEKRASKTSKKSEKSIYAFENGAYEGNLDKRSISSKAGSSRAPSVQSLEVVREQYCCFAKRTRCEKRLLLTVTVLSIVIIVLVIVLAIVAANRPIAEDFQRTFNRWTS